MSQHGDELFAQFSSVALLQQGVLRFPKVLVGVEIQRSRWSSGIRPICTCLSPLRPTTLAAVASAAPTTSTASASALLPSFGLWRPVMLGAALQLWATVKAHCDAAAMAKTRGAVA